MPPTLELLRRIEKLEQEQAQATPVLAAADRWEYDHRANPEDCIGCMQLLDAVSAWHAAREGR